MNSNIFYRLPKVLFKDEKYNNISPEAKLLYCLLLDRASLSEQNGWKDEDGRVFIYFTIEEAMEVIGFGKDKCLNLFKELEKNRLIKRKRQGLGKPVMIFVSELWKTEVKSSEKPKSRVLKNRSQDFGKTESNNTDINNTEYSDTESIISYEGDVEDEKSTKIKALKESIKNQLDYDILCSEYDEAELSAVIEIMTDAIASKREYYIISGEKIPSSAVRERLLSLNASHIEYLFDCLRESRPDVKNVRSYILAALYNAPGAMEMYYMMKVNYECGIIEKTARPANVLNL